MEHIIYRNADNGYTVLNLVSGEAEITCVGIFSAIAEGENIEASGDYTDHPTYGKQFKVESFEEKAPEDEEAIERYLGSGAIRGIGLALAARIVRRFKADTFRIIEEEPERLAEVKGISERKAMEIADQVNEKRDLRQAMIFLQQYGITMNLAVKVYQQYGQEVYGIIRENPYRLADDIEGVGFRTADEIAVRVGIRMDSDFRIRSGILYVLLQASTEGHTYLPEEELTRRTGQLLEVGEEQIEKQYILEDSTEVADSTPDSVYSRRLLDLASPIQFPYNSIVKGYINRYTNSRYGTISRILGMSQYYFPIIEEELLREGLPVELRALPIIESALSPTAVSPMGAVGLWQFMPTTGKSYGLEINSLVDERRDPYRATQAACRYLKDLFAIYNDWSLAIAAYNCGPGNVNKAIARSGGKNFWEIYDYLPRETRGYVPAFIGASYAYAYHRQHGIEPTEAPIPLSVDTVRINKLMHLGQISSTIDLPIETLRQLNPQYKLDIIPATTKPYTLVLPQRYVMQYIAHEPEIQAKDSMYLKEYINPANIDKKRQERSGSVYVVKKGDTLGAIARRYRVTTAQIMRWNKLKSAHKLRIGQRLRIEGR